MEVFAYIGGLVAAAALFLWAVERIAKKIGGRRAWALFLVGVPMAIGATAAYVGREQLQWWEILAYTLGAPIAVFLVLLAALLVLLPHLIFVPIGALCDRIRKKRT